MRGHDPQPAASRTSLSLVRVLAQHSTVLLQHSSLLPAASRTSIAHSITHPAAASGQGGGGRVAWAAGEDASARGLL